jgi:nickel-dependent lactate racemase
MKKILIPYGSVKLEIAIAEKNILEITYPREVGREQSDIILEQAIRRPLGNKSLSEFLKAKTRVLFVVNDATRPTKTSEVFDLINGNIKLQYTQFIIATGAHSAPRETELHTIFGKHYGRYKEQIIIHDARDSTQHAYLGKTRYGNELWLNRKITACDKLVVIGSVEPHYFAGYTGGRKSLLPGVAAYRTIEQNHKFALHSKARVLNLIGNPIHEEMLDCVQALGPERIFSFQMVLDKNHNIYKAFAGPISETFDMTVRHAQKCFSAKIPMKADIVVTVSQPPFDVNLYQTLKAIEHGRLALNLDGILIVVSPCPEGLGPDSFARLFKDRSSIRDAVENSKSSYRLGDHNAVNLSAITKQAHVWTITEIEDRILQNAGIMTFHSLQKAIEQAITEKGRHARILVLMDGSLTVPIVRNTEPC